MALPLQRINLMPPVRLPRRARAAENDNVVYIGEPPPPKPASVVDAIKICQELEPTLVKIDYHCALGGSCLYRGHSDKDIDIFIYPHQKRAKRTTTKIMNYLVKEMGFEYIGNRRYELIPDTYDHVDKDIKKTRYKDFYIDLFFVS